MEKGKLVSIEERIPKLKHMRKKKANRRLIALITVFFLLVLTVIYFQSSLSRIQKIEVSGNVLVDEKEIVEQSEIESGISVWKVNQGSVQEKLQKNPKIKEAEVSLGFPNKVKIKVTEQSKLAYLAKGILFYPVLDNGNIVQKPDTSAPDQLPIMYGFKEGKALELMMKGLEELPEEITNSISEIHYAPKKSDPYHISLFMNDGFEVSATMKTFSEKMTYYPSIVSQLNPNVKGVIDLEVGSYFKAYKIDEKKKAEAEEVQEEQ
ncbi:cell division protein FtsQ [Bacillus ectoiniformans]|uniref:cell division protein FtsQ/DivIB n=1 Tax=Bacillus ectoiniformans TaxID=1494429 RepID=UPI00195E22CB|nr:cell division protein FtsQ/DivIB [Bacillus ectoiniformans]MBM7647215.1 cell division protein FtsQ [Bacillus ectoiniformans]